MPFLRRRQEDERDFSAAPPPVPPPVPEPSPAPEVLPPEPAVESQFRLVEGADEMLDMPLGTLIFRAGLIAPQQLEDALAEGLRSGKRLGEVLLGRGWLSEEDLSRLLAGQKGLPYADIERIAIDRELARSLSYDDARREMALPLVIEFGAPVVAVCDPDEGAMERLRAQLGPETRFVIAAPSALTRLIDEVIGGAAASASTLLTTPVAPEQAQPELLIGEPAPVEAPPAFAEEPVAPLAQEEPVPSEAPVPLIVEGEIDYPTFDSYDDADVIGAPLEQLPADVQAGEYGYYEDPALLEANSWQPGEFGSNSVEPAPEASAPDAVEYETAAYEQPPEAEQPPVESRQDVPTEELASEPAPIYAEAPEQTVEETVGEEPVEVGASTPPWMRGEVNVITADVADFIDSSVSEAPAVEWQPEASSEQPEAADAWEPSAEPGQNAAEAFAPLDPTSEAGAGQVAEPPAEAPAPMEAERADAGRGEYELVLRLSDGDRIPVGTHPSLEAAQAQAGEIAKQFSDATDGGWPFIGGRYLRPETIVSIDVEHHESGWSGSGSRGRMFTGETSS